MTDTHADTESPLDAYTRSLQEAVEVLAERVDKLTQHAAQIRGSLAEAQHHRCPAPDWYPKVRDLLGDVVLAAGFTGTDLRHLPAHVSGRRTAAETADLTIDLLLDDKKALRAELERQQPVVAAAEKWRALWSAGVGRGPTLPASVALLEAVDEMHAAGKTEEAQS